MVKLHQDGKGNYSARKRLPDDVREEYGRLYGPRLEAKFSASVNVGRQAAQQKFREWETEVATQIAAIRASQRGEGIDLTRKDALALAGEWYSWFIALHENDPGKPELWEAEQWSIIDAMLVHAPDHVREEPISGLAWTRDPDVRAGIRPVIADRGYTAQFLASRGTALTNEAMARFLDGVGQLHRGPRTIGETRQERLLARRVTEAVPQVLTNSLRNHRPYAVDVV